uniref:Cystathione beta lyase n=1 Tax=Eleftheria terrae TaxID=1597781 RepID=A0A0B5GQ92_9BURK|nr:cystathione beta lyase [Eleftheria terrae]
MVQPIYQSSIFHMPDHRVAAATEHAVHPHSYYSRWGNPTVSYLENQLSALMGTEASLVFPSGMAAITTTLLTLLGPGDRVAMSSALYGDTTRFFLEELRRWGVVVSLFDPCEPRALPALIEQGARLVYFESISNPELRIADLDAIHAACRGRPVLTVCDCTFSPPGVLAEGQRPADLCLHSLTKYLSGHYSVFGGSVSGPQALIDRIWHQQSLYGSAIDPQAAWQISQGVKTLQLRIARQSASAALLAEALCGHPRVERVFHPSLQCGPGTAARRHLSAGGGVLSVSLKGGEAAALRLVERTRVFGLSVSLGGVSSCIEHAQSMSHSMLDAMDAQMLAQSGARIPPDGLVRLSVGIEEPEDLLQDLMAALDD